MDILIADDDASTRLILDAVLRAWGYHVIQAADGTEAWGILERDDAPRLAILDWQMPGMDGPEICRRVRGLERNRYTYIVMLTVREDRKDVVKGIDAGADDYMIKPFDPDELQARLNAARRQLRVHESLLAAQEAIRAEAVRDPLTGVLNRSAILDILRRELERAGREKTPLSLLMIDVDAFKSLNDAHGHLVGDDVLCEVVRSIQNQLRSYDALGRYGGDEFIVVLPGLAAQAAHEVAERLRRGVETHQTPWGDQCRVSISAGVASIQNGGKSTTETLLQAADGALMAAKRSGKNRSELAAVGA